MKTKQLKIDLSTIRDANKEKARQSLLYALANCKNFLVSLGLESRLTKNNPTYVLEWLNKPKTKVSKKAVKASVLLEVSKQAKDKKLYENIRLCFSDRAA